MTSAAVLVASLLLTTCPASAEDTVVVASGNQGGRTKISGRIVDYNGRELRIEQASGQQRTVAATSVLSVETQYLAEQTEADKLRGAGRFDEALARYEQAQSKEPRRWVRRQIIADTVACYRALDRPERAGEAFLLLVRDDPAMLYFDRIPLAWLPRQPTPAVQQAAQRWMQRDEPAAVLLGASYLLTGRQWSAALARLKQLAKHSDPRIAQLAQAQTWRAEVATATPQTIDSWAESVRGLPPSLAAGPYYVLGLARSRQQQWQQAALALLRVGLLYRDDRPLAAQSLVEAARALEQLGRPKRAARLYREVIQDYAGQLRPVAEARSRLEALTAAEKQP